MKVIQRTIVAVGVLNLGLASAAIGQDVAALIEQLGSWSKNKAKKASDELSVMGAKVVPELIEALDGKKRRQRRFAARSLRQIGQDAADAIPALSKALNDSDALTREYAVEALGKMVNHADQVIPILTRATKDSDQEVREQAQAAIANLTELSRSQVQVESAQPRSDAGQSPTTAAQGAGTEDTARPEPSQSTDTDTDNGARAPSTYSPVSGGYSGGRGLMALIRCALLACVIAGFFAILYIYREQS